MKPVNQALLDDARNERQYSFDEYKAMLNLQCGMDQGAVQSGGVAQATATDKNYSSYIIELHGLDLEANDGES